MRTRDKDKIKFIDSINIEHHVTAAEAISDIAAAGAASAAAAAAADAACRLPPPPATA